MSQIYKTVSSSPSVPTSFDTDSGTATPVGNILNIEGGNLSTSHDFGIFTTGSGDTVTINLTNRVQGRITTTDASNQTLISFALSASSATYTFDIQIAAYDVTDDLSAGYSIFGTIRSTSSVASVIGTPDKIVNEEGAMSTCQATLTVSGNNAIVQVNGLAGKTINWNGVLTYVAQTKV